MANNPRIPAERLKVLWDHDPDPRGQYVLYWMTASRRSRWNYGLDRAVDWARELNKPLVVLEALRLDYPWASDRFHRFVLDGMRANQAAFEKTPVTYYPYVESTVGAGKGLLHAMAEKACVVVTDDSPAFFLPAMLASARLDVRTRFEAVDSNGLLPLRCAGRSFGRAFDFRRFLQRELREHLSLLPRANPLAKVDLPKFDAWSQDVIQRWPRAGARLLRGEPETLGKLPIDHSVKPIDLQGGMEVAERRLRRFLDRQLVDYAEGPKDLDIDGTSGLSGYLHFGHLSPHRVFSRLTARESWTPDQLGEKANGKREGWWGMSASAEAFLDQLVTWRELGWNAAAHDPNSAAFESIPDWAQVTLKEHARDPRPFTYDVASFESGQTHDDLWNAAQAQLRAQGVIHGYLRMLWGKKILHWSSSPREALRVMVELNNKYAIDGRDPNSYSGILWCLGKFDRAWGPERPVFGKVRYMTSDSTRRKFRANEYVARWTARSETSADR